MNRDVWERLAIYESQALVRERLKQTVVQVDQVCSWTNASFSHARNYFEVASDSALSIKPLLIYYGVLNLARGMSLVLSDQDADLSFATHGLAPDDRLRGGFAEVIDLNILKLKLFSKGAFGSLDRSTKSLNLLRGVHYSVAAAIPADRVAGGETVLIKDILFSLPALGHVIQPWQGAEQCVGVHLERAKGAVVLKPTDIRRNGEAEEILRHLDIKTIDTEGRKIIGPFMACDELPGLTEHTHTDSGNMFAGSSRFWMYPRLGGQHAFSKIVSLFLIAFALGMLTRYQPHLWTAMFRSSEQDRAVPAIRAVISYLEDEFPRTALDHLEMRSDKLELDLRDLPPTVSKLPYFENANEH